VNTLAQWGALAFGLVIGWFTYFVNRHRTDTVSLSDVASIIGALGGGAILGLFPAKTALFGAYGLGLAIGFFGYFLILLIMVRCQKSRGWTFEWFLDGRKPGPAGNQVVSAERPMLRADGAGNIVRE
jgi:uncharacterized membrane protein YeaQ/YmgE (transglycosylase-associated protein family)